MRKTRLEVREATEGKGGLITPSRWSHDIITQSKQRHWLSASACPQVSALGLGLRTAVGIVSILEFLRITVHQHQHVYLGWRTDQWVRNYWLLAPSCWWMLIVDVIIDAVCFLYMASLGMVWLHHTFIEVCVCVCEHVSVCVSICHVLFASVYLSWRADPSNPLWTQCGRDYMVALLGTCVRANWPN